MDATTVVADPRRERWDQEAAFFDEAARQIGEATLPVDPLALRRYSGRRLRRRFSKELRFRLLGRLPGKHLLDVGCGDGLNAILFAKMGARVTGIDVSPGALALARRRAEVNGVAERTAFVCAPLEAAELPGGAFDVIWGDGILHHVLPDLEAVISRLARWVKPDGAILFSEPINLCPPLRRLRRMIPVRTEATPGERPLVRSELELVKRFFPDLRLRRHSLFGRLDRFLLVRFNYERSPAPRRALVNALALLDFVLLSLPVIEDMAGTCVMYGHPPK